MPDVTGGLLFLARLPLYEREKPFLVGVPPGTQFDPEQHTNLFFEQHDVVVEDIRGRIGDFNIHTCGFQVVYDAYDDLVFHDMNGVTRYKERIETWLKSMFNAERVVCWDYRNRRNEVYRQDHLDLSDQLRVEQPATDVHNDYTFVSGPITIKEVLMENGYERYLSPGFRYRIINVWRSVLPKIEDAPLVMCDVRSLAVEDIIASDRVQPNRSGEIFHVHYNSRQKWYWLDGMTSAEPWVFVTYDSLGGDHARLCPHSSLKITHDGPLPPRQSIETRSIVISAWPEEGEGIPTTLKSVEVIMPEGQFKAVPSFQFGPGGQNVKEHAKIDDQKTQPWKAFWAAQPDKTKIAVIENEKHAQHQYHGNGG